MPDLDDKPGLAVIIASKRKNGEKDGEGSKEKEEKIAAEMSEEIISNMKGEDPKALGKSLMNFVRYVVNERE